MKPELRRAAELADRYLEGLDRAPVGSLADPRTVRSRLDRPLADDGVPPEQVLDELAGDVDGGLLHTPSGRFFGWVIGGSLPVGIAADWLTSAWDQNAAAYACSPAAAATEDVVAEWLKDLLRLPSHASYAFVTGCQMAHVTCLAAARHRLLADRGVDVEARGMSGSPPIRVLVGEHHETLLRAVRYLGIGTDAVVQVAQRDDGTLDVAALDEEMQRLDAPTIVALAAGDLNRGAFDPFGEVCDLAHRSGAWVHVDGAFGLWVAASDRYRPLVDGLDRADSWATDAHKWLNVPHDCGVAFVADPIAHRAALSIAAPYKIEVEGVRDPIDWGPEWSRRARGFPIYATLRALGRRGVAEIIERCCDRASDLVRRLGELPGVEVLATPIINQGLVRFRHPEPGGDDDAFTLAVIAAVVRGGEAWFGPTMWRGIRVMRVSVSSWRTREGDIDRAVAAVARALEGCAIHHQE